MTESLMTNTDQEEALSIVYAAAVAARAGYVTTRYDLDRDGVDFRIQAGGSMRPAIELQLKATINLGEPKNGCFHYPLNIRNYDLLRIDTQTPRLLVVLKLPAENEEWMTITANELILRHAAYWLNLNGYEETTNQTTITVHIPTEQVFNVEGLNALMDRSREGKL